jgi:hypothetical protein
MFCCCISFPLVLFVAVAKHNIIAHFSLPEVDPPVPRETFPAMTPFLSAGDRVAIPLNCL